ncbi:VWA domain-containing protein [Chloroflexia bacterium SDU3-3]|nr:VWA domain-containing protein [Chloroflexia bacterium SDU3-3]
MDFSSTIWVSFVQPGALWLLVILIPLWLLAWKLPKRLARVRFWSSLGLRTAALVALILALAGMQLKRPVSDVATIFLLDRSESITPEQQARAEQFVRDALLAKHPDDAAGVVLFGQNALVERPAELASALAPFGGVPLGARTNIGQAIEMGISLFPEDMNKRIVLLSDGGQNEGDAETASQLARARGVAISTVDLGASSVGEALVAGVTAPTTARAGQRIPLQVVVESTAAQLAHLRILDGDQVVAEQDAQLAAGTTVIRVEVAAGAVGTQRLRAELTAPQDTQPKNNAAEALVQLAGPPKVLIVEGSLDEGKPIQAALAASGIATDRADPSHFPADLASLSSYAGLVLVNVPASALPAGSQQQIASYVRDLGRGLVVVGGDQAYGIGGYAGTPLADALPVETDVRSQIEHPKVAIVYILDKSRSMQNCHCKGPNRETDTDRSYFKTGRMKLDIGKDAVLQSVAVLSPNDSVGIVTFDGEAKVRMEPQSGVTAEKVLQILSPIQPDGIDTNIGSGLQQAQDILRASDAKIKHAVLMTDGWGEGIDPVQVATSMRAEGITLSVVADGQGSSPALQQLADAGGGRYLPATDPEDIPRLFVGETNQTIGNYMVETPFVPKLGAQSPILSGITSMPQLYGYDATTPKQTATVALYGLNDEPLLAHWQYGLGRAVAWTSDAKGQWAKDWLGWAGFPAFAAQMVGWTLPATLGGAVTPDVRVESGALQIGATVAGDPATVIATLSGPDGSSQQVALAQSSPGRYEATQPLPQQGTYMITISAEQGGRALAPATAGVAVPYSAEYGLAQHNPALLSALATTTGGAALEAPAQAFAPRQGAARAMEISRWLVLLALCVLPLDVMLRRLLVSRPRFR